MGIITVFCPVRILSCITQSIDPILQLSGCTPQIAHTIISENIFEYEEPDIEPGPIVLEALETLIDDDERQGQEDLTVIGTCVVVDTQVLWTEILYSTTSGIIDRNGVPIREGRMDRTEALSIPNSTLRVISHCERGDFWDTGFVSPPYSGANHNKYLVSYGTNIMVQTASLQILSIATCGRMTPERIWRLAMYQGFSVPHNGYDGFDGIDYGEITNVREQCPPTVPGMAGGDVVRLESLGNVNLMKKAIIDEGMFWIWMRPDR